MDAERHARLIKHTARRAARRVFAQGASLDGNGGRAAGDCASGVTEIVWSQMTFLGTSNGSSSELRRALRGAAMAERTRHGAPEPVQWPGAVQGRGREVVAGGGVRGTR